MRFLPKKYHRQLLNSPDNLPIAVQLPSSSYRTPQCFLQKSLHIYCRSADTQKQQQLKAYYKEFINDLQNQQVADNVKQSSVEILDEYIPQTPIRKSIPPVTQDTPPSVTQTPTKYDDATSPLSADEAGSFLSRVRKRSRN